MQLHTSFSRVRLRHAAIFLSFLLPAAPFLRQVAADVPDHDNIPGYPDPMTNFKLYSPIPDKVKVETELSEKKTLIVKILANDGNHADDDIQLYFPSRDILQPNRNYQLSVTVNSDTAFPLGVKLTQGQPPWLMIGEPRRLALQPQATEEFVFSFRWYENIPGLWNIPTLQLGAAPAGTRLEVSRVQLSYPSPAARPALQLESETSLHLVPRPKSLQYNGKTITLPPEFHFAGDSPSIAWLAAELSSGFGLRRTDDRGFAVTFLADPELDRRKEEYRLELNSASGITLRAATPEGHFRAAGRLLSILHTNGGFSAAADGGRVLNVPEAIIHDYPDYPLRGMHLQMTWPLPMSAANRLEYHKRIINAMAMLGFNMAVLNVGNNFNTAHHTSPRPDPWSEADLRELVRFARERGIQPFPGMNTIGHLNEGPNI